jgi:hypothetical protein
MWTKLLGCYWRLMFLPFWFTKLSEYMKVVKIAMVQVLRLVKDERTFNNLSFMKSKFHNWLSTHFNFVFTWSPKTFTWSLIFLTMKSWHFGRRSTLDTRLIAREMQVFYFIIVVFYLLYIWGQICIWNICLPKMQVAKPIFAYNSKCKSSLQENLFTAIQIVWVLGFVVSNLGFVGVYVSVELF